MKNNIKMFMNDMDIKTSEKFRVIFRTSRNDYWDKEYEYWFDDKYVLNYTDNRGNEHGTLFTSELYDLLIGRFHNIIKL